MKTENADLRELTAPCGLDCFNCPYYLANYNEELRNQLARKAHEYFPAVTFEQIYAKVACEGCRKKEGICSFRTEPCKVFKCVSLKGIESCADCTDFPCDNLHPYADMATIVPHNTKVFNLSLMRKMGAEKWAKEKAKLVRDTYFGGKWNI